MCNEEYISKFTNQLHEECHAHNASTSLAVEVYDYSTLLVIDIFLILVHLMTRSVRWFAVCEKIISTEISHH